MRDGDNAAKAKINFKTGEIEFAGSEEFVQKQLASLEVIAEYMGRLMGSDGESSGSEQPLNVVKNLNE